MAKHSLDSASLSLFCESAAMMMAAGIQIGEAVGMLAEDVGKSNLQKVCKVMYKHLADGASLSEAMQASKSFPSYCIRMVYVGEHSGRIEEVLRALGVYYDEEDRLFSKIRSSVGYPAALLCIMSIILAFTVAAILPVFGSVYESISGSLTSGSFNAVGISIGIGWVALGITLLCTIIALIGVIAGRTTGGREKVMGFFEKFPATRSAMDQLAVSRFTSALAIYVASGVNTDDAMRESLAVVENKSLKERVSKAYQLMIDSDEPRSLSQAISEAKVFEQIHARMLTVGTRSGSMDVALDRLSANFFDDAVMRIDAAIDNIEPVLAAFMTVAVGATLIAVMVPLIGIMGSIG